MIKTIEKKPLKAGCKTFKTDSIKIINLFLVVSLVAACSTSPTGRKQIAMMSSSKMEKMGAESFEQIKAQETISKNSVAIQFVQCVADSITPNVSKEVHSGTWEVVVFESDQVNAFALPGGKIGVYTALLKVTENQDQLAAVMGHEVAHVIAGHSNERLSSNALTQAGLSVLDLMLGAKGVANKDIYVQGAGAGVQLAILMPYGRSHESESDIIGQELMAKSGFNPQASVNLWKNMAKQSKGAPPEFMSTHPSNKTRIEDLSNNLSKTLPLFKHSQQLKQNQPNCVKPKSF